MTSQSNESFYYTQQSSNFIFYFQKYFIENQHSTVLMKHNILHFTQNQSSLRTLLESTKPPLLMFDMSSQDLVLLMLIICIISSLFSWSGDVSGVGKSVLRVVISRTVVLGELVNMGFRNPTKVLRKFEPTKQ